jgi:hypothetical protein
MLARIDHVMVCVPDLQHGIDAYTRLECNGYPGGVHLASATSISCDLAPATDAFGLPQSG